MLADAPAARHLEQILVNEVGDWGIGAAADPRIRLAIELRRVAATEVVNPGSGR